jgi:hypothetical protein
MKKTIYVHIGSHKTGTTALQSFFSLNRDILKKNGYLYPGTGKAHHPIARELRDINNVNDDVVQRSKLRKILNEIENSRCQTIVISSEAFFQFGCSIQLKQEIEQVLGSSVDIKIICYCRRQDHLLQSIYQQMVKSPSKKAQIQPISAFIRDTDYLKRWDYFMRLKEWKDAFGRDAIIIRIYEKNQFFKNDLIKDFLHIIGLELASSYQLPTEKQSNIGLRPDAIEMLRIANLTINDPKIIKFLLRTIHGMNQKHIWESYSLLSPRERVNILRFFEESNQRIAREYLCREDNKLFYEPWPDPDEPWEQHEGLTIEKIVPVFTWMLFNLDKESDVQFKSLYPQNPTIPDLFRRFKEKIGF